MRFTDIMLAAAAALAMPAQAQETGQASRGLALAQRLCAECHAIEKQSARMRLDFRLSRQRRV
jgi:cytochrome c2